MTTEEKQSHLTMCDMAIVCDLCDRDSWWHGTDAGDDFHEESCVLNHDRDAHKHLLNYEFIDLPREEKDAIVAESVRNLKPV